MQDLPPDIRNLITTHFDSVEAVELTLLLRRSPETFWSAEAVARQLGMREEVAQRKLNALANSGMLVRGQQNNAFRFAPGSADVMKTLESFARLYSERRASVINTIYSTNLERLRAFSNAFKLRDE